MLLSDHFFPERSEIHYPPSDLLTAPNSTVWGSSEQL